MHTWMRYLVAGLLALAASLAFAGGVEDLDPLLRLLVKKGVITVEEALALQAEAEREAAPQVAEPEPAKAAAAKASDTTSKWYDRMEIKGDVRLRYEGFSKHGAFYDDRRDRFRIRLRAGVEVAIAEGLRFGFQLRNGDPDDPVSNNTSFDGGFQHKEFNLSQGYLEVRLSPSSEMIGGKFDPKDWWTVSDFQWDDDVTVEGAMAKLELGGERGSFRGLELVPYWFILEESSGSPDAYVFGGQARANFALGDHDSLGFGLGFDFWENPQAVVDLSRSGRLGGNAVTNLLDSNGRLESDFEILNLFAEWKHSASKRWPIKVNLFYYRNLGADGLGADEDTAAFGRIQVGDYKAPGQLAFRYSLYYGEPDALLYVFTQSDTSRSSDVKAHRFDLRIGAVARSYFNITWYNTRPALREDEPLDRWQVDYIVRF